MAVHFKEKNKQTILTFYEYVAEAMMFASDLSFLYTIIINAIKLMKTTYNCHITN